MQESIATGIVKPKTTALFFDKLWIPANYELIDEKCRVPKDIQFTLGEIKGNNEKNLIDFLSVSEFNSRHEMPKRRILQNCGISHNMDDKEDFLKRLQEGSIKFISSQSRNLGLYEMTSYYKKYFNIDIIPIYLEPTQFDIEMNLLDN